MLLLLPYFISYSKNSPIITSLALLASSLSTPRVASCSSGVIRSRLARCHPQEAREVLRHVLETFGDDIEAKKVGAYTRRDDRGRAGELATRECPRGGRLVDQDPFAGGQLLVVELARQCPLGLRERLGVRHDGIDFRNCDARDAPAARG